MSDRHDDPALSLLRDLDPKVGLSAQDKQRLAASVEALSSSTRARWPMPAGLAIAAALATIVVVRRDRPELPQDLHVAACAITRFGAGGAFEAALVGPAAAQLDPAAATPLILKSGRAVLRVRERAISVDVAGTRVELAPASLVELKVVESAGVQVAVYVGRADIGTVRIDAGSVRVLNRIEPLEAGAIERARELLAGHAEAAGVACSATTTMVAPAPSPPTVAVPADPVRPPAHAPHAPPDPVPQSSLAPPPAHVPTEAERIADAIKRLRVDHDTDGALALLDVLTQAAPNGPFAAEIALLRVEALEQQGDRRRALAVLDALDLSAAPRADELHLLRAARRAAAGRYEDAMADYDLVTAAHAPDLVESALFGRASVRLRLGQDEAARSELRSYVDRYPHGRFVSEARNALGKLDVRPAK